MGLARREDEAERETFTVRAGMDFTREAAARAAKTLAASPPLAPAAWWWARTTVLSII
jgi:hypothetical protein